MEIQLINKQDDPTVNEWLLGAIAKRSLIEMGQPEHAELSLVLVDEEEMEELNFKYRAVEKATDVLSFPLYDEALKNDEDLPLILGDVVICPAVAKRNAQSHGVEFAKEMDLLVVHGILHLLGFDHETDDEAEMMEAKEEEILKRYYGGETSI